MKEGDEIAVPDYETGAIKWEKIASIKTLEPQHVYDLSIEGTRNFIANDIVAHNTYLATSSGNVGIGTTNPLNPLHVVGAATFAGGVNASSLNVTGFSITDNSLVTLSDGTKKKIKDINAGEEVLTLDETTGKLVPRKVNALLDHGIKPIYEMTTESDRAINTTGEHPYFVKVNLDVLGILDTLSASSFNSIRLPSKSAGFDLFLSSLENAGANTSGLSCGISTKTTENTFSLENSAGLVKSESLVTNMRPSDLEICASLPSGNLFGAKITSNPSDLRNFPTLLLTFSSSRNLSSERDVDGGNVSTSGQISSVLQSSLDVSSIQRREILNNLIKSHSAFQHLQYLPDHDSCAFESRLTVADFAVRNNVLVDFNSHRANNNEEDYLKLSNKLGEWIEVRYLKEGDEIAVPDYENCEIESDLSRNKLQTNNKWKGHVAQLIEHLLDAEEDAGSIMIRKSRRAHTDSINEIEKEEKQAHSLNRTSSRRRGISHEFFLNSEKHRNTHTVIDNDDNNYKNLSVSESNSNYACGTIKWEKIASIKILEPQHVYDLSIEGTRNFIANDIVAHNTYLATSSGSVGIGITNPTSTLHVIGTGNFSGNLYAGSCTNQTSPLNQTCTDIAELFPVENGVKEGDVVCLKNNSKAGYCDKAFDSKILGVISTNPAIVIEDGNIVLGRGNYNGDKLPIALKGKVPVKADCKVPIKQGDLLVSAGKNGYAMKLDLDNVNWKQAAGTILGKALEDCKNGEKMIMAWIG